MQQNYISKALIFKSKQNCTQIGCKITKIQDTVKGHTFILDYRDYIDFNIVPYFLGIIISKIR